MSTVFCLTVRFLDPVASFHGRGDGGEPEWPPSPLRLFQALVAAAASRWRGSQFGDWAKPALQWLESHVPLVVAPGIQTKRTGYRMYVPNNAADLVTSAWARGNTDASIAEHRVEKDVPPSRLVDGDSVHFLWDLPEPLTPPLSGYLETLATTARCITHLGWGVDMVAGNALVMSTEETAKLSGERWCPTRSGGTALRVPVEGTLAALVGKHSAFLTRLGPQGFKPVPPLSAFRVVAYRRAHDHAARPFAAFEIWKPLQEIADLPEGKSRFRPHDAVRQVPQVAGMVRHASAAAARLAGWDEARVQSFILGHGNGHGRQGTTDDRLMFLPLPSITPLRVESIRRLLVVGPPGSDIARIRQFLSGAELIAEGEADPVAMLSAVSQSDRNVSHYTRPARVWSTVTPMILPGHDEADPRRIERRLGRVKTEQERQERAQKLYAKAEGLFRRAIEQAGFSGQLASDAVIEWRQVGFRPGLDLAWRYCVSSHHADLPRYHVRITWPVPVRGPVCLGTGRYYGMGLFAAED